MLRRVARTLNARVRVVLPGNDFGGIGFLCGLYDLCVRRIAGQS